MLDHRVGRSKPVGEAPCLRAERPGRARQRGLGESRVEHGPGILMPIESAQQIDADLHLRESREALPRALPEGRQQRPCTIGRRDEIAHLVLRQLQPQGRVDHRAPLGRSDRRRITGERVDLGVRPREPDRVCQRRGASRRRPVQLILVLLDPGEEQAEDVRVTRMLDHRFGSHTRNVRRGSDIAAWPTNMAGDLRKEPPCATPRPAPRAARRPGPAAASTSTRLWRASRWPTAAPARAERSPALSAP